MLASFVVKWRKDTNDEMDRVNMRLDNTETLAKKGDGSDKLMLRT